MIKASDIEKKIIPKKRLLLIFYPLIWLYYYLKMLFTPPIYRTGIHAIIGETGSGKTLLAHIISQNYDKRGYIIRTNSDFNETVKPFEITEYFNDFKQIKELNNCIVMFDEIQRDFNKRQNRKNEYNEVFIPLIEWLSTHRHNNVSRVYFITQSWNRLDIQLQDYIQKIHFVYNKSSPDLKTWLRIKRTKPFIRPKKIKYFTRRKKDIEQDDIQKYVSGKKIKYKKVKALSVKVRLEDLLSYDTYAFKSYKLKKAPDTNKEASEK